MAIFGSSNLSDSGDLLIFNKVSYKTLLMFEKELGRDRMTYLVEEGLPPDTATASHLESTKADGILFQAGGSDPVALRSAIMERINEGRRVVFLPGPVSHVKGSISQIPPRVIKALEALHISPVPVYAGFYTNSVLDAEADTDAQADIQIHILPKLAPGAEMAARLTSAWLECSAQAYATLPQLHGSLSALLFRSLRLHSDCRVIDGIDDTTLTYGQLLAISVAFAKRLKKITSNRRVGIILPPGKGAAIANLGCLFAGKTPVNFNYSASEGAFASSVKQSGVDWFITADTFMRKLQNFPWPPQRDLILMEREIPLLKGSAKRWGLAIKFLTAGFMIKKLGLDAPTGADEAVLMFTSGTTGEPKMVAHDFTYPLGHIVTGSFWHNLDENSLHLTIADTGWGKAVWGKLYGQWIAGANIFVYDHEKFTPGDILEKIQNYHVTSLCAPPTIFRFLIHEDLTKFDLSSLKYCTIAGEALNPAVFDTFKKLTGIKLMEGFGQTETTLTIATMPWMQPKPGSMGLPNPQYDVDLIDHEGRSVEAGEQGQIVIRTSKGKPLGLFKEYYRDAERTHEAWHDGIYYTGDVAWKDEDGYLWFVGRADDVIKSSGYRIGPFEVESALMTHPAVVECAITGVPDEIRGQVVKATIVLSKEYKNRAGEELIKELQNHVKKVTAPYKYPRVIEFVEELPKTISGKIRRVEIRENDQK